jgi:hypothetical protein
MTQALALLERAVAGMGFPAARVVRFEELFGDKLKVAQSASAVKTELVAMVHDEIAAERRAK